MNTATYDDIVKNIKSLIANKGLKQVFVAKKTGLTPQELSYILNDKRKLLRVEHIKPIADALGVTPNDLFKKPQATEATE